MKWMYFFFIPLATLIIVGSLYLIFNKSQKQPTLSSAEKEYQQMIDAENSKDSKIVGPFFYKKAGQTWNPDPFMARGFVVKVNNNTFEITAKPAISKENSSTTIILPDGKVLLEITKGKPDNDIKVIETTVDKIKPGDLVMFYKLKKIAENQYEAGSGRLMVNFVQS